MKKLIVAAVAAILLTLGTNAVPASAQSYFYHPAGVNLRLTHDGCTTDFVYGNFGNTAFARLTIVTPQTCSLESGVLVQAWGDTSTFCAFYIEEQLNPPDCDITNNGYTIQAVAVGTLIGGMERIDRQGPTGPWADLWLTPIR